MADAADTTPTFSTPQEEIEFWKEKAKEAREELEEFQEGSRELEAELEMQLEQAETKIKDQRSIINRLTMETDQMRDKLEQCQREYSCQVNELTCELGDIKTIRDSLNKYVRDLEQQNDDLERAKRNTLTSVEDFESRLNTAIERNAFLESELDEKESLKAAVQRMKDETRDLKSELRLLAPRHPNLSSLESSSLDMPDNDRSSVIEANNNRRKASLGRADSNKLAAEAAEGKRGGASSAAFDTPPSSAKSSPSSNGVVATNGETLTPSARISALNIVGDLLRKVGALELKLVSCRNIVKENGSSTSAGSSLSGAAGSGTPTSGETNGIVDRSKKIPRGSSTPVIKKIIDSA